MSYTSLPWDLWETDKSTQLILLELFCWSPIILDTPETQSSEDVETTYVETVDVLYRRLENRHDVTGITTVTTGTTVDVTHSRRIDGDPNVVLRSWVVRPRPLSFTRQSENNGSPDQKPCVEWSMVYFTSVVYRPDLNVLMKVP